MSISVTFDGATFRKPGARSKLVVDQRAGQPLSPTGIVGLIGEALGGAPGSVDGVQEFDSTQLGDIIDKYLSGPIVDAAIAAITPSRDNRITNGANKLLIYKTNASGQSSLDVQNIDDANAGAGTDMIDLTSKNYGIAQNQINALISSGTVSDVQPSLTSGVITFPLTLTTGHTMVVTVNGVAYTYLQDVSDIGPHADVAALLVPLNTDARWSPSRPLNFTAGAVANTIVGTLRTDQSTWDGFESQHEYGFMDIKGTGTELSTKFASTVAFASNGTSGGTFTVASTTGMSVGQIVRIDDNNSTEIEAVITDITGLTVTIDNGATSLSGYATANSAVVYLGGAVIDPTTMAASPGNWGPMRGARGNRVFTFTQGNFVEVLDENPNDVRLTIQYVGANTGCILDITDVGTSKTLRTTTSGPGTSGEDLNIQLGTLTISELVNLINNTGGGGVYNCVTTFFNAGTVTADTLDVYSAIDIVRLPLNVKGAYKEIIDIVNAESTLVDATRQSNVYGQVELITVAEYLSGGVAGGASNADFQSGFDAMLGVRVNSVVPLVSQDASADLALGLTDASSTYTISAVNAQADSHARLASNTVNRSERMVFSSIKDTFANSRTAAKSLNSEFSQMLIQDVDVVDVLGNVTTKQPHIAAAIAAGLRAGAPIGEPLTFKFGNISGFSHVDYNSKTDVEFALTDGLMVLEAPDSGGFRFVLDNTTYGKDANFVFNRGNVFSAAQYVAYNLRRQIEDIFVGTKVSSNNATSVKSVATQILTQYRDAEILVGDDTNKGLGFRNLVVTTVGNVTNLDVIITPVQGNEFILLTLVLDNIRQSA